MFTTNNGIIAKRFTEGSEYFTGDKMKPKRKASKLNTATRKEYNTMMKIATENDIPIQSVASDILLRSVPELSLYVMQKGEAPLKDPQKLALQAIMLRANEIAGITRALDTDDSDAMAEIMKAESDVIEINHPDSNHTLPPFAQACINVFLEQIRDASGTLDNFCSSFNGSNGFTASSIIQGFIVPDHEPIGSMSPGGSHLGNVSSPDNLVGVEDVTPQPVPKKSIWDNLTDILAGITTAGGVVKDVIGDVKGGIGDVTGGIKDAASDVGADAITKALKKNMTTIIIVIVAIVFIIVIAIYASKRK